MGMDDAGDDQDERVRGMASWSNGDGFTYRPFEELMRLERIDTTTFRSIATPFGTPTASYGGHVFAQAVWAAAQTVPAGFTVHNTTGQFLLGGKTTIPFVYSVSAVRDGRSYRTRIVNVTQAEGAGFCFTCTCSFKRAETAVLDVQTRVNPWTRYAFVLDGNKTPADLAETPAVDLPWFRRWRASRGGAQPSFPGLDCRKPDMTDYNASKNALEKRHLMFYRVLGSMPPDDPNLHACAHLYASDRNSLYTVVNHFEVADTFDTMGSLSHTVIFHPPAKDLSMMDADGGRMWFVKEAWTTRMADNRGTFHCNIYGPDGTHIATALQDGMIRKRNGTPPMRERKERL